MIKNIKCDILQSNADIICHQVNCQGVMGAGLAKQIKNKYPIVFKHYKNLVDDFDGKRSLMMGFILPVYASIPKPIIINCFAQYSFGTDRRQTDYAALKNCLISIIEYAKSFEKTPMIAFPYGMGCGLAGGDWKVVEPMINETFADYDGEILICEL